MEKEYHTKMKMIMDNAKVKGRYIKSNHPIHTFISIYALHI